MSEYRRPEEDVAQEDQRARVRRVVDQAIRDASSLLVAMDLGEPQDVIEMWNNRIMTYARYLGDGGES